MPHTGRLLFGIILALAALAATAAALAGQLATVNHFQCYRVDPGTAWKPVALALTTQFGTEKAAVGQLVVLCAPAHKNKSVVTNPAAHLACYPIKAQGFQPKSVVITNQFQTSAPMTVVAPVTLCVPSGKAVTTTAGPPLKPPLVKGLDNYECFSVKSAGIANHDIHVVDQFGTANGSSLQPLSLCAPAQVNGSPYVDSTTHLVCYGVKLGPDVKPTNVKINNRFGIATATVFKRQSLCVPSTKKLG